MHERGLRQRQQDPPEEPEPVAPSITAASSSSAGIARMNGRRITIVIGSANAASGSATPSGVLEQAEVAQQEVERQRRDAEREQQPEREERVDASRPRNCSATARTRPSRPGDDERGGDRRDHRAVAQLAPEVRRREDRAVVVPRPTGPAGRPGRPLICAVVRKPPSTTKDRRARSRSARARRRTPGRRESRGPPASLRAAHPAILVVPPRSRGAARTAGRRARRRSRSRTGSPRPRCRSRTRSAGSRWSTMYVAIVVEAPAGPPAS